MKQLAKEYRDLLLTAALFDGPVEGEELARALFGKWQYHGWELGRLRIYMSLARLAKRGYFRHVLGHGYFVTDRGMNALNRSVPV